MRLGRFFITEHPETTSDGLEQLRIADRLQLALDVDEGDLQDEVGQGPGPNPRPVADGGVGAAVGDHHRNDVHGKGPSRLQRLHGDNGCCRKWAHENMFCWSYPLQHF